MVASEGTPSRTLQYLAAQGIFFAYKYLHIHFVIRFDIIVNEDSKYIIHSLLSLFLFSNLKGQ